MRARQIVNRLKTPPVLVRIGHPSKTPENEYCKQNYCYYHCFFLFIVLVGEFAAGVFPTLAEFLESFFLGGKGIVATDFVRGE